MNHIKHLILLCLTLLFAACHHSIPMVTKVLPTDPFKATITPSTYIIIDTKKDNVVEGSKGTVIVVPKGCFRNSKGDIVDDSVKIEVSESLSQTDMVMSNLTTTSNGKPLETDGMIYFNATANGEQLTIDKNHPVHIEIPTTHRKPGMMAYQGIRDSNGNMNWINPQKIDNYLVPVDINQLDFLPNGFAAEVKNGLPFRGHKVATPELIDSLYYSLSKSNGISLTNTLLATNYNEAYYNKNKKVENGKYTSNSYVVKGSSNKHMSDTSANNDENKGIDPAIIAVIKSPKYQNTIIATREFEARLKVIFKTCDNSILEIYIKNLDKNMYELDSMAAEKLKGTPNYDAFVAFSKQRLTNVENAGKYASLLRDYYNEQIKNVNKELQKNEEKAVKKLEKKTEEFQKTVTAYEKVLDKRETYRMEKYGFNWTQTGWINVDNGDIPKDWGMFGIQVTVSNSKQLDRVYIYVIYTSLKSLYRLNSTDKENFYAGNVDEKQMLMPKHKQAFCIAIGYKGDVPYLAVKEFETVTDTKLNVSLSPSSVEGVKAAISPYEDYSTENKISGDLYYMQEMYTEEKRQNELEKESEFINKLWDIAHPCCMYKQLITGAWELDSTFEEHFNIDDGPPEYAATKGTEVWVFDRDSCTVGAIDHTKHKYQLSNQNPIYGTIDSVSSCGQWVILPYELIDDCEGLFIEQISTSRMELTKPHRRWEVHLIFHRVSMR